jgi:hypothetical protein
LFDDDDDDDNNNNNNNMFFIMQFLTVHCEISINGFEHVREMAVLCPAALR